MEVRIFIGTYYSDVLRVVQFLDRTKGEINLIRMSDRRKLKFESNLSKKQCH